MTCLVTGQEIQEITKQSKVEIKYKTVNDITCLYFPKAP